MAAETPPPIGGGSGSWPAVSCLSHPVFSLDAGCGSGILSFFAGARKIYAVEASTMAQHAEVLVKSNNLTERIVVIPGKVEEVSLPEQVDIIISEPMGYVLFNERMLESHLHAKKYLKPPGESGTGDTATCRPVPETLR
ncbi:histone-arginine methyltransferase CARM1-like [Acridotheres tristis]